MSAAAQVPSAQALVLAMLRLGGVADTIAYGKGRTGLRELGDLSLSVGLDRAGLAPDDALAWLLETADNAYTAEASVLVLERAEWRDAVEDLPGGDASPPEGVVWAEAIEVPGGNRTLVVPNMMHGPPGQVMLYADRLQGSSIAMQPIGVDPVLLKPVEVVQQCRKLRIPTPERRLKLACESQRCTGNCQPERFRVDGATVAPGCVCR